MSYLLDPPENEKPRREAGAGKEKRNFSDYSSRNNDALQEIERSLLNEIITEGADFGEVKGFGLKAEDFYTETHRLIFEAMEHLHDREEPIDLLTVHNELGDTQRPDGEGFMPYLTNLPLTVLPTNNVEHCVKEIREASRLRKLSEAAYRLYEAAEKGDTENVQRLSEGLSELQSHDFGTACITLANHRATARTWIIEGLFPDCFPSIIYGAGGLGKSFLALHLATLACLGGKSFMGYQFPREPLNVLIVDYELDADTQRERAEKIARGLNLAGIPPNLHYYAPDKALTRTLPEIRGLIKRHGIRFVIIDSIGASRTDGESVQDIVNLLTGLKNLGVATLLLDHQSKMQAGERYEYKTPFGTVYKENLARSVFQLSKIGEGKSPMTLQLRHKKANFSELTDDLIFDVHFHGDRVLFTESEVKTSEAKEIELIQEAILELEKRGVKANQKALAEYLKGIIGQKRLRFLLEKYDGEMWETLPGDRTEKIYKLRTAERHHYSNCHSAVLENSENEFSQTDFDEKASEFLNEEAASL